LFDRSRGRGQKSLPAPIVNIHSQNFCDFPKAHVEPMTSTRQWIEKGKEAG
jgi:hypothetical protein